MTESKLVKSMAKILKKSSISKKNLGKLLNSIHFALPWGILGIICIGPNLVSNRCFNIIRNVNIIISSNGGKLAYNVDTGSYRKR